MYIARWMRVTGECLWVGGVNRQVDEGECLWVGGVNHQVDEGERGSVCGLGCKSPGG